MDKLTCFELKTIEELRLRMRNILKPDMYEDSLLIYRFLKARDFDVDEAENMLRKHMTWRKLFQVDTILEDFEPKPFFHAYAKPSLIGFDKDGCLVIYSPIGKVDMREILRCVKMNDYLKHWIWYVERNIAHAKQQNKIKGANTNQASIIFDLDKLTLGNATCKAAADLFLQLTNIYQNNYPEHMKAIYLINAPAYYIFVFAVIKAVMSSVMIQKIHVFGHSGWKEKLLDDIDADVLPAFLGGKRTDPEGDPLCRHTVNHGGKVSPIHFLSEEERYFEDRSRVTKILVPNSKKKEISVDVKEQGSVINWKFYSKSSIWFGLFYQTPEKELKEVIPIDRYDTSDGTEEGHYKVRLNGKYIIVFDNTCSWLRSAEVEYYIEVLNREV